MHDSDSSTNHSFEISSSAFASRRLSASHMLIFPHSETYRMKLNKIKELVRKNITHMAVSMMMQLKVTNIAFMELIKIGGSMNKSINERKYRQKWNKWCNTKDVRISDINYICRTNKTYYRQIIKLPNKKVHKAGKGSTSQNQNSL